MVIQDIHVLNIVAFRVHVEVEFLIFNKAIDFSACFLSEGLSHFAWWFERLRPKRALFRCNCLSLPRHSFLVKVLIILCNLSLFLFWKEVIITLSNNYELNKLPQSFGFYLVQLATPSQESNQSLNEFVVGRLLVRIKIDIEKLFKDRKGNERVDFLIAY